MDSSQAGRDKCERHGNWRSGRQRVWRDQRNKAVNNTCALLRFVAGRGSWEFAIAPLLSPHDLVAAPPAHLPLDLTSPIVAPRACTSPIVFRMLALVRVGSKL